MATKKKSAEKRFDPVKKEDAIEFWIKKYHLERKRGNKRLLALRNFLNDYVLTQPHIYNDMYAYYNSRNYFGGKSYDHGLIEEHHGRRDDIIKYGWTENEVLKALNEMGSVEANALKRDIDFHNKNSAKKNQKSKSKTNIDMKKKSSCTSKKTSGRGNNTVAFAAKTLKAQKADYQKIFRAEVKNASDPKQGAKKAGQIYRDRYGATATARWKKALKRAK